MLNQKLLHKLKEKYPNRTNEELTLVVKTYFNSMNMIISSNTVFNLDIPKLGRIHTHGNAVNKTSQKQTRDNTKLVYKRNQFTDEQLLF